MFNYLKNLKPNIVFLCETHLLESEYSIIKQEWGQGEIYINELSERSAGQMILLTGSYDIISYENIVQGRCQQLDIKIDNNIINLINIYAPNRENEQLLFTIVLK